MSRFARRTVSRASRRRRGAFGVSPGDSGAQHWKIHNLVEGIERQGRDRRGFGRAGGARSGESGLSVVPGPVTEGFKCRLRVVMGCPVVRTAPRNAGNMIIPVIQCQITHRKQSGRRYNSGVLRGAALGVELVQGIGLNPRGTHMRFVSTRWSLSAAGLLSALALAACSSPAPAPAPAPAPVVTTAPPMAAPMMTKKHSKAWYRRHHHKHRKM